MLTNVRFSKSILGFPKMDIYKCPISISWKRIWSKKSIKRKTRWELLSHIPNNPQMAPYHLELSFNTIASLHPARSALIHIAPFHHPSTSLFYTRSREKISPSWEVQKWVANWDMSADYTCTPSPHPSPFVRPYFLSWVVVQERKLYTRHYTPFRGSPEMSGKLRYESQIILRYYPLIIHEVSLERPTI